jgi:hypothetical protein
VSTNRIPFVLIYSAAFVLIQSAGQQAVAAVTNAAVLSEPVSWPGTVTRMEAAAGWYADRNRRTTVQTGPAGPVTETAGSVGAVWHDGFGGVLTFGIAALVGGR